MGYMIAVLAVCTTVLDIGIIVMFVGSTTIMINTFIFPSLLYLKLVRNVHCFDDMRKRFDSEIAMIICVFAVGIFGIFYGMKGVLTKVINGESGLGNTPACWLDTTATCST